jgi:type I restriction enzyme S subunit
MKLPDGWSIENLDNLVKFSSGGTPSKNNATYWNGDIPWISASTMHQQEIVTSDLFISETGLASGSKLAKTDDLLLLVRGSMLWKKVPICICKRDVAFNQDVKALRTNKKILPTYLLYWFLAHQSFLLNKVVGTGIGAGKIDFDELKSLEIVHPPLPEQKAIADLLSTWDEAIGKTERLIQAKENQFKWMLQGLTSKPQKDTEWEKVKLGEIGEIKKGKGITKDDLTERGIPCIRYAEIYTLYDFHVSEIQSCVTQKAFDSALKIEQGDVLFAASGETKEEIGKCIVYLGTKTACTGGDTLVFKAQLNLCDPMFMGFALNHPDVNRQKSSFAHGNSVVHLYGKDLANIYLILPPLEKQKQIAETLSTAQHEIDLLKQLAEKYKTQKRGLMQKMLTGEWRVKEEIVKNIER